MPSDSEYLERHRTVWANRPELQAVYHEFFNWLLDSTVGRQPVVEIGSGPGFFKQYRPDLISTDVLANPWIDHACDAWSLPFESGSMGSIVMLDTLHHLPKPLDFMAEAARVLQPGGRLAMIEPWITPLSFILYRYFHHEDCSFAFELASPFDEHNKPAFDGNAVIPYQFVKHFRNQTQPMRLVTATPFLGLAYLATLGFKRTCPLPPQIISSARFCERVLKLFTPLGATRILAVWEKTATFTAEDAEKSTGFSSASSASSAVK